MAIWKCPACEATVQHQDETPRLGVIYRCQVCRLDLVYDPSRNRLVVTPLPERG